MKKWKTARKDAQREARKLAEKLRPLEDKLEIELEMHNKKRWSTFDAKHASLIAAHKEATKLSRKAICQYRSSKYRVARKGGWGFSSYRDVQRCPIEHDEVMTCETRAEPRRVMRREARYSATSGLRRRVSVCATGSDE